MRARYSKFLSVLPATYPGCWRRKDFRREYKAAWMAEQRRIDPEYRDAEREEQRKGPAATTRPPSARRAARMKRMEVRHLKRLRSGYCFYCGQRRATEFVERLRAVNGETVTLQIPYCGKC